MSDDFDDRDYEMDDAPHMPAPLVPAVAKPEAKQTPTEAKAQAVGALLAKSVDKASELRLTPEETKALKAEFPDDAFRPGAAGKQNLIYIEHMHLRNRLDEVLGMGQWSIVPLSRWEEKFEYQDKYNNVKTACTIYVEAALIVRGCYCGQSIGDMTYYPDNAAQNYGDAVEGAKSACLRRCAKEFGVGLQAWSKTWCESWWRRKGTETPINQQTPETDHPASNGAPLPACPKCGKTDSVIIGKAEYGGGYLCWKKKPNKPGCGHKWDGKDVRTGEEAAPSTEYPSIIDEWRKRLDRDTVNIAKLNGEIIKAYKAIGGKHPERTKVWNMICDFAEENGVSWNKGESKFMQHAVA